MMTAERLSTWNPDWEDNPETKPVIYPFPKNPWPDTTMRVAETAATYYEAETDAEDVTTGYRYPDLPGPRFESTVDRRIGALEYQIAELVSLIRELKEEVRCLKINAIEKPAVNAVPASRLDGIVGLVAWGGDALEDTERLYDGDN